MDSFDVSRFVIAFILSGCGFFVLEPGIFDYVAGDATVWEREPLERLAQDGELMAFRHEGFFQPMDTMREKQILEELWQTGKAPWTFPA